MQLFFPKTVIKTIAVSCVSLILVACASTQRPSPDAPNFEPELFVNMNWFFIFGSGEIADKYEQFLPTVEGDIAYAAHGNGQVLARNYIERKNLWMLDMGEPLAAGVSKVGKNLYVVTSNGELVSFTSEGEENWRVPLTSVALAPVIATEKLVFVHTQDGKLSALDVTTGQKSWIFDSGIPRLTIKGAGQPVLDNDLIYAGFANGKIIAFDQKTGEVRWEQRLSQGDGRSDLDRLVDVDGQLTKVENLLIASATNGFLTIIDLNTGRKLGDMQYGSSRTVIAEEQKLFVVLEDDTVVCLDPQTREEVWRQERFQGRALSNPAYLSGYIMVSDYQGYLYALDAKDGRPVGKARPDYKGLQDRMVVAGDRLLVQGYTGRFKSYSISPSIHNH